MELHGRAALVTGGASGIGAATVSLLRAMGARVASVDLRPTGEADVSIQADVGDEAHMHEAIQRAQEELGLLKAVVLGAGIGGFSPIRSMSLDEWDRVHRVLLVRLRSIGDTVLATPSLIALRRFLPEAQIDILLEAWVAPLLNGFDAVHNVLTVGEGHASRLKTAREVGRNKYDVVFNLHGGTTATFFVRASGARHRVGYSHYKYKFLYNHLLSSASDSARAGFA